jgi:hypothetical protein
VVANATKAQVTRKEAPDQSANKTHHHIHDGTKARTLHELTGKPACDEPDNNPRNDAMTHNAFPFGMLDAIA